MDITLRRISNFFKNIVFDMAIPVFVSLVFCFLIGINPITFWKIVIEVFIKYFAWLIGIVTAPDFMHNVHQFFRQLVFVG